MPQKHPAPLLEPTEVGSVFVSNYPPYSAWRADDVPEALSALALPPAPGVPLGLYLHIPFCRMRCKFCYFKVYTEKDSRQVREYLSALVREVELYARQPAVAGRPLKFVYFGGGTPSFLGTRDLRALAQKLKTTLPWAGAEEITFECEPGTLTAAKLEAIRSIGVTRLSLGVESFDDAILEENGRAHRSAEIRRAMPWIRACGFDQLNVDLIAGMMGETWDTWRESVRRTIDLDPDSVTIYQMELPYNTVYSQALMTGGRDLPVASWELKRAWHGYAIDQLGAAGYIVSSAYTMVKASRRSRFVYRDAVWHGADMIGAGVASFSHVGGVHFQNESEWERYMARLQQGELPLARALRTTPSQRLTREVILQLKLGRLEPAYFRGKFGAEILVDFQEAFSRLRRSGMLGPASDKVELTRDGLLRVDHLIPELYDAEYRSVRYT